MGGALEGNDGGVAKCRRRCWNAFGPRRETLGRVVRRG